jgi:hypothetical protein
MTKYFITVLRYYVFDADSDDEALAKFNDESAFNEMIVDDESPAIELYTYDEQGEHKTLWSEE